MYVPKRIESKALKRDLYMYIHGKAYQVVLGVKNLPANAGDIRDEASIPRSERSLGGGYGNPLQYSCLENPMNRGL